MLNDLAASGKTCGLKFNLEKSVVIDFSRCTEKPPFALTIDGREIEFKTEVRYLGVTLESKLHWTHHINDKLDKMERYLAKITHMTVTYPYAWNMHSMHGRGHAGTDESPNTRATTISKVKGKITSFQRYRVVMQNKAALIKKLWWRKGTWLR